jgi:hypothetical protein
VFLLCQFKPRFVKNSPEGKRSVGQPRKRWMGDVENDLNKMGVRGCIKIATDRDAWKLILKEVEGPSWAV